MVEEYADVSGMLAGHLSGGGGDPFAAAAAAGRDMWRYAVADVQEGRPDDRPLYWARMAAAAQVRGDLPPGVGGVFAWHARGMGNIGYPSGARHRVLITGFDPFHLDRDIGQSNPSGLAALALDGVDLTTPSGTAHVRCAILPVRFRDFDDGLVERFVARALRTQRLSMIVTLSMGRDRFDLERFPGRRRSTALPDNDNRYSGGTHGAPLVPRLGARPLDGPEFLEFSLPAQAVRSQAGRWPVRNNPVVATLERGRIRAAGLAELDGQTAVEGSGGGYLSNEISYRTLRLCGAAAPACAVGHVHTPSVAGHDAAIEAYIVHGVRLILGDLVAEL